MDQEQMPENENQLIESIQSIGFLDYVTILLRWRRFIIINFLAVATITLLITFLLPKWYKATASILPPKDQSLLNFFGGGASSVLKGLTSLPKLGGLGQNTGAYNYFAILKSRSAMEAVAKKFNLPVVYDVSDSSMEKTIKQLQENTSFELQDDDYITIEVTDKDPGRAADMANYFTEILNTMSIDLGTQEARNNKAFIAKRLEDTRDSLRNAEDLLKRFQEKSGLMISPEQTSSVSSIAELYAAKAKKEVEFAILERTVTADNQTLQSMKLELRELEKKLGTFPQAGLQTFRLYRDVVTQQKILEVLIPLYEQAKVNEQKDIPILLVLDKAVPPQKKIRPQRTLIIVVTATVFLFLFFATVFIMHGIVQKKRPRKSLEKYLQTLITKIALLYRVNLAN